MCEANGREYNPDREIKVATVSISLTDGFKLVDCRWRSAPVSLTVFVQDAVAKEMEELFATRDKKKERALGQAPPGEPVIQGDTDDKLLFSYTNFTHDAATLWWKTTILHLDHRPFNPFFSLAFSRLWLISKLFYWI